MGWFRKPVWLKGHRGFKSLPLRHLIRWSVLAHVLSCLSRPPGRATDDPFAGPRRGGRVAEGARLESVCGASHRGFESLPLRQQSGRCGCRRLGVAQRKPREMGQARNGAALSTVFWVPQLSGSPTPTPSLFVLLFARRRDRWTRLLDSRR